VKRRSSQAVRDYPASEARFYRLEAECSVLETTLVVNGCHIAFCCHLCSHHSLLPTPIFHRISHQHHPLAPTPKQSSPSCESHTPRNPRARVQGQHHSYNYLRLLRILKNQKSNTCLRSLYINPISNFGKERDGPSCDGKQLLLCLLVCFLWEGGMSTGKRQGHLA